MRHSGKRMLDNWLGHGQMLNLPLWAEFRYPNRSSTIGFPKENPINQSEVNPVGVEVATVSI